MAGRLVISDANILIDMEAAGLLRQMFRLDVTFGVPDVLYEEELREQHPELLHLGLKTLELKEAGVGLAAGLVTKYQGSGANTNDLLALALAQQERCPVLTGDRKLRTVAEQENVEFHGTVWLVGLLIRGRIITVRHARAAYDKMKRADRWLPWDEVKKQLEEFED